jgi:hypothetical protein
MTHRDQAIALHHAALSRGSARRVALQEATFTRRCGVIDRADVIPGG